MKIVEETLSIPLDFRFPYIPYPIQNELMKKIFEAIENGGLGLFESPTGTGKTMSIICSTLTWLRANVERQFKFQNEEKLAEEPSWIAQFRQQQLEESLKRKKELQEKIKKRFKVKKFSKKERRKVSTRKIEATRNLEELEELLSDYYSDDEGGHQSTTGSSSFEDGIDFEYFNFKTFDTKIIYCSRTHSQLSQFVAELKKTSFENINFVLLASRKQYCINEKINKHNVALINELCLDLKEKTNKGCAFCKKKSFKTFADRVLRDPKDLMEVKKLGVTLDTCPYYSTREAIKNAEIIAMPYNMLLHNPTRSASGVDIKGNVVVIDEAHNIIEALSSVYSVSITLLQLLKAEDELSSYFKKYRIQLNPKNVIYIKQLLFILKRLRLEFNINNKTASELLESSPELESFEDIGSSESVIYALNEFAIRCEIENMNLYKLEGYCAKSRLANKLNGFAKRQFKEGKFSLEKSSRSSAFQAVQSFIFSLTSPDMNARVILEKKKRIELSTFKFFVVSSSEYFSEVIKDARCVILCGGTLRPHDDLLNQLVNTLECSYYYKNGETVKNEIKNSEEAGHMAVPVAMFSCNHVIPPENLLVMTLSQTSNGRLLNFSYETRNDEFLVSELGRIIVKLCETVSGGIICFFPSYEYMKFVYDFFLKNEITKVIMKNKRIFMEPKESGSVEKILVQYAHAVHRKGGALILCVVGGKLSEGINFKDELGRLILMIGLPYPNKNSLELKEKMNYLCAKLNNSNAGTAYYQNLCMRAVNQSIGRAIRHEKDYAAILLLDYRFSSASIQEKLPTWMMKSFSEDCSEEILFDSVKKFFMEK
ncbi:ATP-dependent DNA helicase DDX11-like isoform X2 [Zophobas morio]|uniref:ATP-dependent DNA helicase DDX11-like isoform X2 n=1 Tax=Zophobas morio TaxID=2755281 RepID=UPI0030833BAB